jgi:hypothetical protein
MLLVKPLSARIKFRCPYCQTVLQLTKVIWQGTHVCVHSECTHCGSEILNDLPIGHAIYYPYQIDVKNQKIFGPDRGRGWLGQPLLRSLLNPSNETVKIHKHVTNRANLKDVVVVDCLDFMYGHCLLKLFNVQRYKQTVHKLKIIVIIPDCLRWLVPTYVHEIWSVNLPLDKTREYNLTLETFINNQLKQYERVFLCDTFCHPRNVLIQDYSGVSPAQSNVNKRITYFWRHDRLLTSDETVNKPFPISLIRTVLFVIEKYRIISLFCVIKRYLPDYSFALVGIGTEQHFPKWIQDFRIPTYDQRKEKIMCSIFAKSSIIIGTLGSHMILPATHAFMTLELHHKNRTECFGQNMIIPSHVAKLDPRLYYFRHRIIPSDCSVRSLANVVVSMINDYQYSKMYFPKNLSLSEKMGSKD